MSEAPASPTNDPAAPEHQQPGLSDERLMLAFSQGSSEAFTELFHRYKQPVYGFFCRRLADPVNAEELTQETFFALLRAAARYEPRALFRTYLYAIGYKNSFSACDCAFRQIVALSQLELAALGTHVGSCRMRIPVAVGDFHP